MSRYDKEPEESFNAEQFIGFIVATELRSCGVDLSFTPELDLDYGVSSVIGTRAFHRDPEIVTRLAESLIHGLNQAGMGACGKHFPGPGAVQADSHVAVPVDDRDIRDRTSTRLNSSHVAISYAVLCLKKKRRSTID